MEFDKGKVARWIERRNTAALASWLMSGTHHGKPGAPAAIKLKVAGLIRESCADDAARVVWAERLMACDEAVARSIACGLVASGWRLDREATIGRMKTLAEDADWEVREWAADLLAGVLALDFAVALSLYADWVEAGSEELRRAVALGLAGRSRARVAAEAPPMLAIIERLMSKPGAYLQKNLGPFALGGAFLGRFPDETLALCRKLARRKDEHLRWNLAMCFTTAAARKHRKQGEAILDVLAGDERKRVASAVAKARVNLAKG